MIKRTILLFTILLSSTLPSLASHDTSQDAQASTEEVTEREEGHVGHEALPLNWESLNSRSARAGLLTLSDKAMKKEALRKKYGGYTPLGEFEILPAPLIAFGFLAKANKKNFRQARNNFIPSYKNRLDDYMQHFPLILTAGLKVAGYKGRSNIPRFLVSGGASYAFMGIFVNGIKYTAKEMRPDGSTANSFPSGHTATAFVAATILHKEYGQTRSPWFSVAGYGIATTTGIMRTLNNRHWISDILVGGGLGVLSTYLGYMVGDLLFKDKGIQHSIRTDMGDMLKTPSFFRFSLGMQSISNLKMPTMTEFQTMSRLWDAPGAASLSDDYYLVHRNGNPFRIPDSYNSQEKTFGNYSDGAPAMGASTVPLIRISTGTSVTAEGAYFVNRYLGFGLRGRITTAPAVAENLYCYDIHTGKRLPGSGSASDVYSVADVNIGIYGNVLARSRHAIGVKALYGRRLFSSLDLQAVNDQVYRNKSTQQLVTVTSYGDDISIAKTSADDLAIGLSYTYSTPSGIAIAAYIDYDYSKPEFTVEYAPYNSDTSKMMLTSSRFSYKQKMHSLNFGASVVVPF